MARAGACESPCIRSSWGPPVVVPRANAAIDQCIPMGVEVSRSPGSVKPTVKLIRLFT
jgi:hypothetical protein